MNASWKTSVLSEICHVYQPETLSHKQLVTGDCRVYGANGQIGWHNEFNHEESELILGCRGTCGAVHVTEPRSWINGNAMVVRPINGVVTRQFLAYALKGGIKITEAITGTAQPQITRQSLMSLTISFPTEISEQQRIVRLLDDVFEGIDVARANSAKNLQNAREIFERQMQSVFSQSLSALHGVDGAQGAFMSKPWQTYSLGELTARKPISYGVLKPGPRQEVGVPLIRITDIKNNNLDETNLYHITQSLSQEFKRTILQGGEVLLSIQGTIGRVAICPRHLSGANISRTIALIAPDERVNREFLRYWLLSAQDQFPVGGATRDSLNIGDIRNLQCPAPPLTEQHRIVRLLQELESSSQNLSVVYTKKLSALNNLSKSFLDQAFSGNLKTA